MSVQPVWLQPVKRLPLQRLRGTLRAVYPRWQGEQKRYSELHLSAVFDTWLNFGCTVIQLFLWSALCDSNSVYVGWWTCDWCVRCNDVSNGDLRDSAAVWLSDSAAGLHQSGAGLLEHVEPDVSCFFDATKTVHFMQTRPAVQLTDVLFCMHEIKV